MEAIEITFKPGVGVLANGVYVPGGIAAVRFVIALIGTVGGGTRFPKRPAHYGPRR